MIRSGCDYLMSEIIVRTMDKYIKIIRKIIIKSKTINELTCYYKDIKENNDVWTPITSTKIETEKYIQNYIGTIEDFMNMNTFMQNQYNSILEDSGAELKNKICNIFNLETINELCKLARTECNNIKANLTLTKKIILELDNNKYKNMLESKERDDIIIAKHMMEIINKYNTNVIELTKELDDWTILLDLLDRNGLSLWILKNIIDRLGQDINNMLNQFGNYQILFKTTENNIVITMCKNKNKYSIQRICGYEKFLVYFLMKISTRNISNIMTGDILLIDEAISCFDKFNILKINKIFDVIRLHYKHIFIISHIDISHFVDGVIDISERDGYSVLG
jgi:DNA repair exonuclease SbcCD ATPase subunit